MLLLHQPPANHPLYTKYTVTINGTPVATPAVRVSAMPYNTAWPGHQRPIDQTELAPMLSFASDEPVTLQVTYPDHPQEVVVRPLSRGIKPQVEGNKVTLTLTATHIGAYTLEADGFHEALHIFFDPVKDFEAYAQGMDNVLYYDAGVHHVGKVELQSNTAVILHKDAWVYGSFVAFNAQNIKVCGYGVLDGSLEVRTSQHDLLPLNYYGPIPKERQAFFDYLAENHVLDGILRFYACQNIRVEGVTLHDAATFALIPANCEDVVIDNVKAIGMWRYNADGIDLFNCKNVTIRNCFLRNFDDCIVLKGICGWDEWSMEHILVENCVTWCDWGRNLELGAETNAPTYHDITFRNCDCIHGSTIFCDIQHHNSAEIYDVTFEDIRCEYTKHQLPDTYQHDMTAPFDATQPTRHPTLMAIPIYQMGLFAKDGRNGSAYHITFRNIQMLTDSQDIPRPVLCFQGLDDAHKVSHVTIDGVYRDGVRLTQEQTELAVNEFVTDVCFL